jgi:hypothetical protein
MNEKWKSKGKQKRLTLAKETMKRLAGSANLRLRMGGVLLTCPTEFGCDSILNMCPSVNFECPPPPLSEKYV